MKNNRNRPLITLKIGIAYFFIVFPLDVDPYRQLYSDLYRKNVFRASQEGYGEICYTENRVDTIYCGAV